MMKKNFMFLSKIRSNLLAKNKKLSYWKKMMNFDVGLHMCTYDIENESFERYFTFPAHTRYD